MQERRTEGEASRDGPDDWPSDWLRATLAVAALRVLESGPSYGYAVIEGLAAAGFGRIRGGTLYPLLSRHEQAGLVTTEWRPGTTGPGRKYFTLTDAGRSVLDRQREDWARFSRLVAEHLTPGRTPPP